MALAMIGTGILFGIAITWSMTIRWEFLAKNAATVVCFVLVVSVCCKQCGEHWLPLLLRKQMLHLVVSGYVFSVAMYQLCPLSLMLQRPWMTEALQQVDSHYLPDWHSCLRYLEAHPFLFQALDFAYGSGTDAQIGFLFATMCIFKSRSWHVVCVTFIIAVWATAALAAAFPALPVALAANESSHFFLTERSRFFREHMVRIYNQLHMEIPYTGSLSIIEFPAYHASIAVLCMHAAWSFPWLIRLPLWILNILIILATPVMGLHYFSSTIAGVLVALFAILTTHAIMRFIRMWCLRRYGSEELPLNQPRGPRWIDYLCP